MKRAKFIVRLPRDLLEGAKRYAQERNTTLTRLVSEHLRRLSVQDDPLADAPIVRRLSGTLSQEASIEDYDKYLEEKYGSRQAVLERTRGGKEMGIGRFYAFVGALLRFPPHGKYLLLKRSADKDFGGGAWECVTGRVDQGEGFSEAVRREVYEELGIEVHVDFIIGTGHFYRGEARPENEMVGVQYCCSIDDPDSIQVSAEHSEYRWVTVQEARQHLPDGHWLRATIARAEAIRALLSPEMLEFNRANGLEL